MNIYIYIDIIGTRNMKINRDNIFDIILFLNETIWFHCVVYVFISRFDHVLFSRTWVFKKIDHRHNVYDITVGLRWNCRAENQFNTFSVTQRCDKCNMYIILYTLCVTEPPEKCHNIIGSRQYFIIIIILLFNRKIHI